MNEQPIGIFDSGIGGLTVMKQIMKVLPHEQLIYFADTARLPYGDKSPETILRYSIEDATFLMEQHIKLLVIACNTASAYAFDKLQQILKIPVIGVIKPGADHAVHVSRNQKIGVIATKATTKSGVYQSEILQRLPSAKIYSIACPLLVPLIEEHLFDHAATRLILRDYLIPLKEKGIDTLVLGCTHYPLLRSLIQEEMGPDVSIIDPAYACADQVLSILNSCNLRSSERSNVIHQYYTSGDPEKFRLQAIDFLGQAIDQVHVPEKMKFEL